MTIRDSAGIEIVESESSGAVPARISIVGSEPLVQLGRGDSPGHQLTRPTAATRLSTDGFVVLEATVSELRFFDPQGIHVTTVGGTGGGPGEFRLATDLIRRVGDTLLVLDAVGEAVSFFDGNGQYLTTRSSDRTALREFYTPSRSCRSLPMFSDGSFLGCAALKDADHVVEESVVEYGLRRQGFTLVRLHTDTARVDKLGVFKGLPSFLVGTPTGFLAMSHPLLPSTYIAIGGEPSRLYLANNDSYEVEVWDPDGELVRLIRRVDGRVPVTTDVSREAWEVATDGVEPQAEALLRQSFGNPGTIPPVQGLASGPGGELWVKRTPSLPSTTKTKYDVFDPQGIYIGEVIVEADLELLEVGIDYVLAVHRDRLDVPYVLLYRLERDG